MFSQPRKTHNMLDTYGCFAFHSGLLASGCPSPEDTHPMHGEFCCADMDRAWLEIEPASPIERCPSDLTASPLADCKIAGLITGGCPVEEAGADLSAWLSWSLETTTGCP